MKKGEVKKFPGIKYNLYNAESRFIGHIDNETEFLQARLDLALEGCEGFFVIKQNGDRVIIHKDGSLSENYDLSESLRSQLASLK